VRTINVGNGPRAVAVGANSVWVANNFDGTVSRIDPGTSTVTATIPTGRGPSGVAVGARTVWVANEVDASLTRIDPATNRPVLKIRLSNPPKGLALAGGSVLVTVRAQGLAHRGGTLTVYSGRRGLQTIDPSVSYESYSFAIPSLTNDGLVAFKHVGGSDGSTLVPDVASSLPLPTDAGKTYTFELRSGIRYATGQVVRAEDFQRAVERLFMLSSPFRGYFTGIVGGARCAESPETCDLSKGIVVDNAARLVTFRLVAPDPDFLYKLTFPATNPVPPGVPKRGVGTRPMPGTGPYKIARYVPKRELVFVRNPFFRVWSQAAKPAGYPDRIVWRLDVKEDAATRAVEKGEADVAYDFVPPALLTEVRTRYASQLHVDPIPGTYFYLLNARVPPFDDVRVRRALNYAVDRDAVIEIAGAGVAQPTCQVLPPSFPGYRPYCPYTANPSASGRWVAPDLGRARRLVAASGTKGERVQVWATDEAEGEYVVALLRRLGYQTRLRAIVPYDKYTATLFDPRNFDTFQIAQLRWFHDYPAASGFISSAIFDCTYFCDRRIDRKIARARALQETDAQAANALWVRVDRDLTDQAPWLFLYNRKQADFVSSRVGNFQYSLRTGILLDQLWVK
jgi:YVTN family beta-propeller protein